MYPEDRVLVAFMPRRSDLRTAEREGWYRIPEKHAPKGLHAEYIAFYFGADFGAEKWAIHRYARRTGHELVTRLDLFPTEPDHPRANEPYYKISLGPIQRLPHPIVSLRWRRLTFVHTTWDRFLDAKEVNDLFVEGGTYVDRLYATLKDRGIQAERRYGIEEAPPGYEVPIAIPCANGLVEVRANEVPKSNTAVYRLADEIERQVERNGGQIAHR